ncbi:lysine-2,3-aminomutase-like protein [Phaeovulum sp.]|uniref:lysine-2,3-aminomutase-like protein n=1 Tax=Phaeovulum sp. TaxID=2934796 RepID=UPI00356A9847
MPRPDAIRKPLLDLSALMDAGLLASADAAPLAEVAQGFPIRIAPAMAQAMQAQPDGPIARQFLPALDELDPGEGALSDPIGDTSHAPVAGLTHRYPDRVILHVTRTCDVHCRFCFRREVVGGSGPLPESALGPALAYIAARPAIREVILTGGDPLTLSPRRIGDIARRLAAIGHVELLRLHSRGPVVTPERITPALIAALKVFPVTWLVVHTNHADELTQDARAALARLVQAGVPLLSQTVLLRGVNDSPAALEALFRALLRASVKPYYLHHCDLARGAAHFRTTIAEGRAIMEALQGRLSGIALPRYVIDIPGGFGKVPLNGDHLSAGAAPGEYLIRDPWGGMHRYRDPARPLR